MRRRTARNESSRSKLTEPGRLPRSLSAAPVGAGEERLRNSERDRSVSSSPPPPPPPDQRGQAGGGGWGGGGGWVSWPDAERSHRQRLPPTPDHPEEGEGITLTPSAGSEDSEEEEADTLAKRAEQAGEGNRPLLRFPPERDLSLPDECLRSCSGREDSQARSHQPGKAVAEAAPAEVDTPGAGIADEQATGDADVTGAAGPGRTPTPVTLAAETKYSIAASCCSTGPDRLKNNLTRSGKEDVGRATRNRRGGLHCRPRVAATAGSNNSLRAIPVTPSRAPTPFPRLRAVRGKRRAVTSTFSVPGSGQKTAHWQRGSVTSHGKSTFVHATANGPWSESATRETSHATPETANRHSEALHENLDLAKEMIVKSVSGSW